LERAFEKRYHSLERTHWWFVSRRNFIDKIVRRYHKNIKILEIGCSSGQVIRMLEKAGYENVIGMDVSEEAIRLCGSKGISKVIRMEGSDLGFKENVFDLVIASDVLEHISDDFKALCEWKRVLKKGGDIVAFVPAFKSLWSGHDVVNRHFRRYNKSELLALFKKSKLNIRRMSYWNFFLFLPISFRRLIEKRRAESLKSRNDLFRFNRAVNFFLLLILKSENMYCRFFNLPLGLSLFVIARK
jgi:ubiquinone/menaquinone biosynthesis C-methylase UbiE